MKYSSQNIITVRITRYTCKMLLVETNLCVTVVKDKGVLVDTDGSVKLALIGCLVSQLAADAEDRKIRRKSRKMITVDSVLCNYFQLKYNQLNKVKKQQIMKPLLQIWSYARQLRVAGFPSNNVTILLTV